MIDEGAFCRKRDCSDKDDLPWPFGYNAWLDPKHEFASLSLRWISMSGLVCSLYKYAVFWRAGCGPYMLLKDPLELFMKRREFLPGFGFLLRDMT